MSDEQAQDLIYNSQLFTDEQKERLLQAWPQFSEDQKTQLLNLLNKEVEATEKQAKTINQEFKKAFDRANADLLAINGKIKKEAIKIKEQKQDQAVNFEGDLEKELKQLDE